MKRRSNLKEDPYILEKLNEVGINYFSCTSFNEKLKPLLSTCNNDLWLSIYRQRFSLNPPVQQIILNQKKGLIWWDSDLYSSITADFIKLRNNICETKMICTIVPRKDNRIAAISFGTKYNHSHIVRFLQNNTHFVQDIFDYYLNDSIEFQINANDV
jgi:hypothetical protein